MPRQTPGSLLRVSAREEETPLTAAGIASPVLWVAALVYVGSLRHEYSHYRQPLLSHKLAGAGAALLIVGGIARITAGVFPLDPCCAPMAPLFSARMHNATGSVYVVATCVRGRDS